MPAGKERVAEVVDYAILHGDEEARKIFSLTSNALNRYKCTYKKHFGENADLLLKIRNRYSETELRAIADGKSEEQLGKSSHLIFDAEEVTFGLFGDTHIGSKYTDEAFVSAALEEFDKRNCQFIAHTGDVTEGMSGRDGHCYELTHIGYKAQKEASIRLLSQWKKPSYYIAGNHDCHLPDTECLTREGWKTYDLLSLNDEILSYDIVQDKAVWMPITDIIVKQHEGDILDFNYQTFKQAVTPNHRMLYSNYHDFRYFNKTKYQYGTAELLYAKPKTHKVHFKISAFSANPEYTEISDAMLRVVSWLLTDGSIRPNDYCIYQSKDVSPIIECLTEAQLDYKHSIRSRNITEICGRKLKKKPLPEQSFRLHASAIKEVSKYLTNKQIPQWAYKLSDRQFEIMASVFLLANGSCTEKGKNYIDTFALHGRYEFLNEIQILFVSHGFSTGLRQDIRGAWVLDVCKRQDTCIPLHPYTTKKYYKGQVWCISTPLTNFMIRRNGRPSFTGNCWYMKKGDMGADVVADICDALPNSHYIGINEGSIFVNNCEIRLWHGEDASSYSTSYRLQKLVESFSGGTKPKVLVAGHTHKQGYFFDRNIHIVSTGAIQKQSGWMRYKRLAAHTGFHVIKMGIRNGEVIWFEPRWYPFYE